MLKSKPNMIYVDCSRLQILYIYKYIKSMYLNAEIYSYVDGNILHTSIYEYVHVIVVNCNEIQLSIIVKYFTK